MSIRFQKRIKILPWIYLNISKSGFSFSFGKQGIKANVSSKGIRGTVGIPGTGVSYSKILPRPKPKVNSKQPL
jgi:hypothetical protein